VPPSARSTPIRNASALWVIASSSVLASRASIQWYQPPRDQLGRDQGVGGLDRRGQDVLVAGRLPASEIGLPDRRRARRLDPALARARHPLAPARGEIGRVLPQIAAFGRDLLAVERDGPVQRRGRLRGQRCVVDFCVRR
jgi:hypothetical protein